MKVLVINAGSSSIKYQLLNMDTEAVMASGLVERIGEEKGVLSHKRFTTGKEEKTVLEQKIADHREGMHLVINMITAAETGVIKDKSEIDAIGHRTVQGGEDFSSSILVTEEVKKCIEKNNPLAPLHNPANLTGIAVAEELFPGTPNVAVFDTEFHQTMPPSSYIYPIPYELYKELKIRRYGFHGTSHKYVAKKLAAAMGKAPEEINIITVHLGNGGSISAVKKGKCVDTSMGMTPLAGVMMGTRCGDIDPAIVKFIMDQKGLSIEEVDTILNKKSGLLGIAGMNDMRDLHAAVEKGNEMAKLALDIFVHKVKQFIGAYTAVLGTVDGIVFTAGIGENDDIARAQICADMQGLGIEIDTAANSRRSDDPNKISTAASKVQVWVIPTNEELQIAQDTIAVLKK